MLNENFDAQKVHQIQQLEAIGDRYRSENQKLHADLSALEQSAQQATPQQELPQSEPQQQPVEPESRGTKRPASTLDADYSGDQASQQLRPLLRKNKILQIALAK
jgi:hypothetical protein